ncbi:MAG: arginine--tRNA ligase [Bacteroidetes bacterium]|nr:arginine--tRNA ligase [Bacteroidota bacterium]
MNLIQTLQKHLQQAFQEVFQGEVDASVIKLERTLQDFSGDYTLVVFPYVKQTRKSPEQTATLLGEYLLSHRLIARFNVVKGFLNMELTETDLFAFFVDASKDESFFKTTIGTGKSVVVEYSSPNTNKPLHLGHIRNNLLGYSVSEILKVNGYNVTKANLINDRGIHICKSMLAWQQAGLNETPESTGMKGDHLVGKYYVAFDKNYKAEISTLVASGMAQEEAEKQAPSILAAQQMLRKWEAGDADTMALWKTMNGWVYAGFEVSYKRLGVDFDKFYYESDTYLLGKSTVKEGLDKKVFYQKEDGSVWIDLTDEGLDQKLLLRSDGTSVYITQDIGTAQLKYDDFHYDISLYVVGNEQDYHFKVLQGILKKLDKPYAAGIKHVSYGMVDLPSGKMKSREGTVVDADDLMEEMHDEARIDFEGNTGPYIQYTNARINSVLEKAGVSANVINYTGLLGPERELILALHHYQVTLGKAAEMHNPAEIANYVYDIAKRYNRFYYECPIAKEDVAPEARSFRVALSILTGNTITECLRLLGIKAPRKM